MSSSYLDKYEYLTGEDLNLKPSTVEQAKFEYSPLGKIFNKGLDTDDAKKEGLFKWLTNIEKSQSSNNNNLSSPRSESSEKILVSDDKDEDENAKIERDLYQGSIKGMKGLKLPVEIESKDEKFQMYLENNLNKIKNNFSEAYCW